MHAHHKYIFIDIYTVVQSVTEEAYIYVYKFCIDIERQELHTAGSFICVTYYKIRMSLY